MAQFKADKFVIGKSRSVHVRLVPLKVVLNQRVFNLHLQFSNTMSIVFIFILWPVFVFHYGLYCFVLNLLSIHGKMLQLEENRRRSVDTFSVVVHVWGKQKQLMDLVASYINVFNFYQSCSLQGLGLHCDTLLRCNSVNLLLIPTHKK